ncbi:FMN-binding protein [Candidatus Binatia bacterium]|nr:FMN-binding protein [Candidatus Binatia bacterium]
MTVASRVRTAVMAGVGRADRLGAVLLACALGLNVALPRPDAARRLAESLIGPVEPVAVSGPPAFRAGSAAVLFFDVVGVQGPVRGAVVVDEGGIEQVLLVRGHEGVDRTALLRSDFLERFRGRAATPPLVVHTVTGATVSSQRVVDAVNERLQAWKAVTP